jgi:hypothetical protein
MVGYRVLLAYGFMTLLTLPRALQHSGYLFHYCGHTCLPTLLVSFFLRYAVYYTTSFIRVLQTPAPGAGSIRFCSGQQAEFPGTPQG